MNMRQRKREERIDEISKFLKKHKEITEKEKETFLLTIMGKYGLARRTAYEYLRVAEVMNDISVV